MDVGLIAGSEFAGQRLDDGVGALFDLDNTLIKGSALYHLAGVMVRHGLVDRSEVVRHAGQQVAYRWRGEHLGRLAELRDRVLSFCAGLSVTEVVAVSERVYDERLAARIWPGTRALAECHRRRGEPVWLVTGAPIELAQIIARHLGFTGGLGTVAEVANGRWTGRLASEVLHGPAKARAVEALAACFDLDLGGCAAYSDSVNDLPLLDLVGDPHAVNPDRRLRQIAHGRGWPIHDLRARHHVTRAAGTVAKNVRTRSPMPRYSRGSTGSLSSASTPKTHS